MLLQNARQGQAGSDDSSSIQSPTKSSSSKSSIKNQRPTTYRPNTRRDDNVHVQVIRAIDYDIPKTFVGTNNNNNQRISQYSDTQPHNSYTRVHRFQGDQKFDSFVRY